MPFCPDCRYEFDPHVEKCSECGAALVDSLPEPEAAPVAKDVAVLDDGRLVFCPMCFIEFPPHAGRCPECGVSLAVSANDEILTASYVALVAGGMKHPEDAEKGEGEEGGGWVVVYRATNLGDAGFLQSVLEEHDIESRIEEGADDGVAQVSVATADAEKAGPIVADAMADDDSDEPDETAVAPKTERGEVDRLLRAAKGRLEYGEPKGALDLARQGLALRPKELPLIEIEAQALSDMGDEAGAREAARRGLKLEPARPLLIARLFWSSIRGHDGSPFSEGCDLAAAVAAGEVQAQLRPRDVRALEVLAEAMRRRQDLDGVRRYARAALDVNPDFAPAKRMLDEVGEV